jgi:hypothetical protein
MLPDITAGVAMPAARRTRVEPDRIRGECPVFRVTSRLDA